MHKETSQPKANPTPISDDHPFVRILKRHKDIEADIKARFANPVSDDHPFVQLLAENKAIEAAVKRGESVASAIDAYRRDNPL